MTWYNMENWRILFLLLPLAAFIGGSIMVDDILYKRILGILLVFPILRFLKVFPVNEKLNIERKIWMAPLLGLFIGFVSGLIGIGGGIILSPIILLLGWANMRETASISALFIFLNSITGYLGAGSISVSINENLYLLMPPTILAGAAGAYFGANKFKMFEVRYILTVVLIFASVKLIMA
jgi:uncharacterized protein